MSGWARLIAAVEAENAERGEPISGYVGWQPSTGWYGGTAYEGEPMEETATVQPEVEGLDPDFAVEAADKVAGKVADRLQEYRARLDAERAEIEAEDQS